MKQRLTAKRLYKEFFDPAHKHAWQLRQQIQAGRVHLAGVNSSDLPKGWIQVIGNDGDPALWLAPDSVPEGQYKKVGTERQDQWHAVGSDGWTHQERSCIPGSRLHAKMHAAERAVRVELESEMLQLLAELRREYARHASGRTAQRYESWLEKVTDDCAYASSKYVAGVYPANKDMLRGWIETAPSQEENGVAQEVAFTLKKGLAAVRDVGTVARGKS